MLLSPVATFSVLGLCLGYGADEDLCSTCATQRNAPDGEASDATRLGTTLDNNGSDCKNARFVLLCGPHRRYLPRNTWGAALSFVLTARTWSSCPQDGLEWSLRVIIGGHLYFGVVGL